MSGRLSKSQHLASEVKHPIILPAKHRVTMLIIAEEDHRCNHTVGPNHLLSYLMQKFWIVKGKAATRAHRSHCVPCKKRWAVLASQRIAPLPDFRTSPPLRAFSRVGIDFAGPFSTKQGRGRSQTKRYVCVITCLQSRACHLEMAYGLDSESFLLAFTRFSKRCGVPQEVVSDNGTNFVGAERELHSAVEALKTSHVSAEMASNGIKWTFNPPKRRTLVAYLRRLSRQPREQ